MKKLDSFKAMLQELLNKHKKLLLRASAVTLVVGLIVYTVYHVVASSSANLMTTPTRQVTDLQMVSGEGYWFRDESVLTVDGVGIVDTLAESGAKVSKNLELAEIFYSYGAEDAKTAQNQLDRLNRMIALLEASRITQGTPLSHSELYRAEANRIYLAMQSAMQEGKWSEMDRLSEELLVLLNKHGALVGDRAGYETALAELREQKRALLSSSGIILQNEVSSGYYFDRTYVDGYETFFDPETLEGMTLGELDRLKNTAPLSYEGRTVVGKMVYSYTRYLLVEMEGEEVPFLEGELYELYFPQKEDRTLTMTCRHVIPAQEGRFAVVFETGDSPAWLGQDRICTVEVVAQETVGYYVPDSALHILDGVEGVYIFEESTVRFRRVEILYRGDGYCVVAEQGELGSDYLALHDLLITEGKDLYDGKVY